MAQYLCDHLGISNERLLQLAGIDEEEFIDYTAFNILEIALPPAPDDEKETLKEDTIE